MRLPGLGPKTARRIWQELGIDHGRRAAGRRRGRAAPRARGDRARDGGEDRRGARPGAGSGPGRSARCSERRCRSCSPPSTSCAQHPAADEVSLAGSARRMRETVRDLDIIATATDPQALVDYFCTLPWVVEVAAKGATKATVVSHDGLRFDLARRAAGVVRQPAAALHRLEGPQRRAARGRGSARALGLGVRRSPRSRRGRSIASRPRRRCTGSSATTGSRRSSARTAASSRPRAAASSRSSSRCATCAATCTRTRLVRRQGHARDDGRGGAAPRLRLLRDLRPLAAAARRSAAICSRLQIDALNEQRRAVPDPEGHRGEHPGRRLARRLRRGARDA